MKKIIKLFVFCILSVMFCCIIHNVFMFKSRDGIYNLDAFYKQEENSIDLLIVGSSHTTVDIDSGLLWDESGISSYTLWGSGQPIWNSYFYMKEALKTQTPKLIILEGYTLSIEYDYGDSSSIIKNTYGLKWSNNRIEAIKASVPEEKYIDYLISVGQYHNRYSEISNEDFEKRNDFPYFDEYKGTELSFANDLSNQKPDIDSFVYQQTNAKMTEKTEYYYRKCIELAQENNIPILVTISPFPVDNKQYSIFLQAKQIAQQYNVEFINGNDFYEEMKLDFSSDFADKDHLNYKGNSKWTRYLNNFLIKYKLPNRKSDKKYESWEINANHIRQLKYNQEMHYIGRPIEYINAIKESPNDYTVLISLDGNYEDIEISKHLESSFNIDIQGNGTWILEGDRVLWDSIGDSITYHTTFDNNNIAIINDKNNNTKKIIYNKNNIKKVENGINITVYDNVNNMIVESVGFDAKNNYTCIK